MCISAYPEYLNWHVSSAHYVHCYYSQWDVFKIAHSSTTRLPLSPLNNTKIFLTFTCSNYLPVLLKRILYFWSCFKQHFTANNITKIFQTSSESQISCTAEIMLDYVKLFFLPIWTTWKLPEWFCYQLEVMKHLVSCSNWASFAAEF